MGSRIGDQGWVWLRWLSRATRVPWKAILVRKVQDTKVCTVQALQEVKAPKTSAMFFLCYIRKILMAFMRQSGVMG